MSGADHRDRVNSPLDSRADHLRLSKMLPATATVRRPATLRALRRTASAVMPASCATTPSSYAIIAATTKLRTGSKACPMRRR
jgi:hypothetical protein